MTNNKFYSHEIIYFKTRESIIGCIPSLDLFFSPSSNKLPTIVYSKIKPLSMRINTNNAVMRELVLTGECNLNCKYCFEGSHLLSNKMDTIFVEKNIREMFTIATKRNNKRIKLLLFGGEPTLNWNAIETSVFLAEQLEKETGILCHKSITTNGIMSQKKMLFLADHFDGLSISFDGPEDIYLQQRIPKGGKDIFNTLFKNSLLAYNRRDKICFIITVTKLSINKLKEIDDFFTLNFPACSRLYQPCMASKNDELYISCDDFLKEFYELKKYSVFPNNLSMPLIKKSPRMYFCGLNYRDVVYPDKRVLGCHRGSVCDSSNPISNELFKGNCLENGEIDYSSNCERLTGLNVDNIDECKDCPFRYHCCSGCFARKIVSSNLELYEKVDYCETLKHYALSLLSSHIASNNDFYSTFEQINIGDIKCLEIMDNDFLKYVSKVIRLEEIL